MLTYEHRLKFRELMLLLSCLWHAFLEFLLLLLFSTLKQKTSGIGLKARNSRKSSRNKSWTSSLCLEVSISKQQWCRFSNEVRKLLPISRVQLMQVHGFHIFPSDCVQQNQLEMKIVQLVWFGKMKKM